MSHALREPSERLDLPQPLDWDLWSRPVAAIALQRVEGYTDVADQGVRRSIGAFQHAQCLAEGAFRRIAFALLLQQVGKVVESRGRFGVVIAEGRPARRDGRLIQGFRLDQTSSHMIKTSQVIQRCRSVRMTFTQSGPADSQGSLQQALRSVEVSRAAPNVAEAVNRRRRLWTLRAQRLLKDGNGFLQIAGRCGPVLALGGKQSKAIKGKSRFRIRIRQLGALNPHRLDV